MKKVMKKLMKSIVAIATTTVFMTGCGMSSLDSAGSSDGTSKVESTSSNGEKVITYGMQQAWDKLMPYDGGAGYYGDLIFDKIYDKLVFITADGDIEPRAAEKWEWSDDNKTATFHLNKNSKWHDGENVTAKDWVWTFQTMSSKEVVSGRRSEFAVFDGTDNDGIETSENSIGVEAPDDYTFVVHFKNPTGKIGFLVSRAKNFLVLPQHLLKDIPKNQLLSNDFWLKPVGSGPLKYSSEVSGNKLDLDVFKDYYLGKAGFDKLSYQVVQSSNMATSLLSGSMDTAFTGLSIDDIDMLEKDHSDNVDLNEVKNANLMSLLFNNQTITDSRVRKAFDYGINKQLMVDQLLKGRGTVGESLISPISQYSDPSITNEYNVDKAKQLLQQAGWDSSKTLQIAFPAGIREQVATLIQQDLQKLGVNVQLNLVDFATMLSGIHENKYDMILVEFPYSPDPLYFRAYIDPLTQNLCNMPATEKRYSEFHNKLTTESDLEKRKEVAKEYQQLVYSETPLVSLYFANKYSPSLKKIKNIDIANYTVYNEAVWKWSLD